MKLILRSIIVLISISMVFIVFFNSKRSDYNLQKLILDIASVHEASRLASACSLEVLAFVHNFSDKSAILAQRKLVNALLHMDCTIVVEHVQFGQEAQRQALGVVCVGGQIVVDDGAQESLVDVVLVSAVQKDRTHRVHQIMTDNRL